MQLGAYFESVRPVHSTFFLQKFHSPVRITQRIVLILILRLHVFTRWTLVESRVEII